MVEHFCNTIYSLRSEELNAEEFKEYLKKTHPSLFFKYNKKSEIERLYEFI